MAKELMIMITTIFTFIYVVLSMMAIGTGITVLFGLLTGELFYKWAVLFLQCTLAISLAGLLFPFHDFLPTRWVSMLSVYGSGVAFLAWRKFHLTGVWSSVFALSATVVLYLDVLIASAQVFKYISLFREQPQAQSELPYLVTQLMLMVFFVILGFIVVKRFRGRIKTFF
jgi:hypothetical protein